MKIISFNLDGLHNAAQRGFFDWMIAQQADVVCLQQTLCYEHELPEALRQPGGYLSYFYDAYEKENGGVAIYCKRPPKAVMRGVGLMEADVEGRYMQVDYDQISVASLCLPAVTLQDEHNRQLRQQMRKKLLNHLGKVRNKRREFIFCGDFQVAHLDIDSLNSAEAKDNHCLSDELSEWMDDLLDGAGYVDAFRELNDEAGHYSWWPPQQKPDHLRDAWRVDYQLITSTLRRKLVAAQFDYGLNFSSHAPLTIEYALPL